MSLFLYGDHPRYIRPSQLLDQHFGYDLEPEDFISPLVNRDMRHLLLGAPYGNYMRPWRSGASLHDSGSTVACKKDRFEANLDVQQFRPEEISVKVSDGNVITIEGKHEEKQDEHGYISRQFMRKYVLPKGHDAAKVESKLSSDGILTITAPKVDAKEGDVRSIQVVQTGAPSKAVEDKQKDGKQANGEA